MRDPEQTIGNLVDKQSTAYISSIDEDGYPIIKAMNAPRMREGIRVFYLSTNTSSQHVQQFRAHSKGCLYFCDRRFFRGAMLRGTFEVLEDAESKEMIWQPGDTMYYPEGVTDPDYCVLKFTAEKLRFYSKFKSETIDLEHI